MTELPDLDKEEVNMVTKPVEQKLPLSHKIKSQMSSQNSMSSKSSTGSTKRNADSQFFGDFKNDGSSGDFDSQNYPHSREMTNVSINYHHSNVCVV